MKKILAVVLGLFLLAPVLVYAEKLLNRYYVGIGVTLDHDDRGFRIVRVLEGSPADKAGIREGDFIVRVDDKQLHGETVKSLASYINGDAPGTKIDLLVTRADYSDEKYFRFSVERGRIDRVAWLSQNAPVWGNFGNGNLWRVSFKSSFVEDKERKKFIYSYSVSNDGKKDVMVQWVALGVAARDPLPDNESRLIFLKAGATREFKLETEDFPEFYSGEARIFMPSVDWLVENEKMHGFKGSSNGLWHFVGQSSMPAYVPAARLKKR